MIGKSCFWGKIACILVLLGLVASILSAQSKPRVLTPRDVVPGAEVLVNEWTSDSFAQVAVVAHAGSVLSDGQHLVDALVENNWPISFIYAPEHGFRSDADAGASVSDGRDPISGLPLKSLYGSSRRPKAEDLQDVDVILFDLQDVGVRFYTYLSTLYYVLDVAAECGVPVIVLDRPNPNGFYVDGPVLDSAFSSFVGALPVPVVHGMTLGEMAQMIVGEAWVQPSGAFDLQVVPCKGYRKRDTYKPAVPPSPNLPNLRSILLYPSLCFFEATSCSIGRGTDRQFQLLVHPDWQENYAFSVTPEPKTGAKSPKHQGKQCFGLDFSDLSEEELLGKQHLDWSLLTMAAAQFNNDRWIDRPEFMNLLMGTDSWNQLFYSSSAEDWSNSYAEDLQQFKDKRKKYLIYPE